MLGDALIVPDKIPGFGRLPTESTDYEGEERVPAWRYKFGLPAQAAIYQAMVPLLGGLCAVVRVALPMGCHHHYLAWPCEHQSHALWFRHHEPNFQLEPYSCVAATPETPIGRCEEQTGRQEIHSFLALAAAFATAAQSGFRSRLLAGCPDLGIAGHMTSARFRADFPLSRSRGEIPFFGPNLRVLPR